MATANRLTSKGQVTIPVAIRRKLGLKPGDPVRFVEVESQVHIERAGHSLEDFDRWIDELAGSVDFDGRTTDEIMDEIRPQRLDRV